MVKQMVNSFEGFSFSNKIRLLLGILIKKMIDRNTERLITTRGLLFRIIQKGGKIKDLGKCFGISLPLYINSQPLQFLLRKKSTDTIIFSEIIINDGGDYKLINKIAEANHISIATIVDAGANIGCATTYFRNLYPDAAIVAIEPDKGNFEMLNQNISLNKYKNITTIQKALWINNDELNFGVGVRGSRERELSFGVINEGGSKVKGYTFPDCLATFSSNKVDLLKIDIEGAEKALIEDREGFDYLLKHTQILAIELHPEVVDPLHFLNIIKNAGFTYLQHGEISICWRKII